MIIGIDARSAATKTSVPAAARKSSRYVNGYGADDATIGGSRWTSAAGFPPWRRYAPGQLSSQTGKRKPCGLTEALGPIHGSGQSRLPPCPHFSSAVTLAGGFRVERPA